MHGVAIAVPAHADMLARNHDRRIVGSLPAHSISSLQSFCSAVLRIVDVSCRCLSAHETRFAYGQGDGLNEVTVVAIIDTLS
jgi:hypothetical protein